MSVVIAVSILAAVGFGFKLYAFGKEVKITHKLSNKDRIMLYQINGSEKKLQELYSYQQKTLKVLN